MRITLRTDVTHRELSAAYKELCDITQSRHDKAVLTWLGKVTTMLPDSAPIRLRVSYDTMSDQGPPWILVSVDGLAPVASDITGDMITKRVLISRRFTTLGGG